MRSGNLSNIKSGPSKWSLWKDRLNLIFNEAGPGFCHFAITNRCDAGCKFCNFAAGSLRSQDFRSVSRADAFLSMDILFQNGIRYIEFVGGEPLLHKDILAFVSYAHRKGMSPMICTHGGRLTNNLIHRLKEAGLSSIIISIDAPDIDLHEKNRGIKDLCKIIQAANIQLKKHKISCTASVTISKLISDYDQLPEFLKSMGFSQVTFSYPMQYLGSGYLGFSSSDLVHYTPEHLFAVFEKIKELKKRFFIVNNKISLTEMQKFLLKIPQQFSCLGGYRYFLLDWNLDIYRCHFWESPICKIHEFEPQRFIRDRCNRCMLDCYRDASVLQYMAVSLSDTYKALKSRRFDQALKIFLDKNNLLCLKAVAEQLQWIIKI
jgi:MoaA/NifB/PqqE/SkfB family radical SAM enzyme